MVQPINYLASIQQPNIQEQLLSGLKVAASLADVKKANEMQQKNEAFKADFANMLKSPSWQNSMDLVAKYPEFADKIQAAKKLYSDEENRLDFDYAIKSFRAATTGNVDIAKKLTQERIDAKRNSGQSFEEDMQILKALDSNPNAAAGIIGAMGAAADPSKWEAIAKASQSQDLAKAQREKAQFESAESRAKAQKAAVDSKFAESNALLDLQQKGWNIKQLEQNIAFAKENQRIAMLDKQLQREEDALRREELKGKLADAQAARDSAVRQKAADAERAVAAIDNSLSTIQRVLNNPSWRDVVGSFEGGEWIGEPLTLLDDEEQDAIAAIETLSSQVFLTTAKEFGSTANLSGKEGDKLQATLASLTRKQSEESFQKNLEEADRLIRKARSNVFSRSGMPETPLDIPQKFTGAQPQPGRGTIQPAGTPLPGEFSAPGVVPTGGVTQMPAGFRRLPSTQ